MKEVEQMINKLINLMNVSDFRIETDPENRKINIFLEKEDYFIKKNTPALVNDLNHLVQLIAKKENSPRIFIDINNYRCERERLLIELAKAAARKVLMTKQEISLPSMNSYERRIVHLELSIRPDVRTESIGLGKERYIIVKPIIEE